jgi:hypothetical protein
MCSVKIPENKRPKMKEYLGSTHILEMFLLMYFIHNKMCDEHYYEPKS